MANKRTELITKQCIACGGDFNVCPPGKSSRTCRAKYDQVFCSNKCSCKSRYRSGIDCAELSDVDAAYIAGFLDGEGSIMIIGRADAFMLRVSFANNKRNVLEWIREKTGVGNVTEKSRENQNHATSYMLLINSNAANSLLKQVSKYLIIKKEQSLLAMEFFGNLRTPKLKSEREWQAAARATMQELNHRGK